jgi:hypothetical protein
MMVATAPFRLQQVAERAFGRGCLTRTLGWPLFDDEPGSYR